MPFPLTNNEAMNMDEFEKCNAGLLYDTTFPGREAMHLLAADLCYEYNHVRPSDMRRRDEIIRQLFGKVGKNCYVEPDMYCGFGFNIEVGDNFYSNNNCNFMDPAKIIFGDNVFIGAELRVLHRASSHTSGPPQPASGVRLSDHRRQ